MKTVKVFFIIVSIVLTSCIASAANHCLNCFEQIDENEKYCVACKVKLSVDELKTQEEQLIHAVTISRENYRKSLEGLKQYYQSTGNQLRLQNIPTAIKWVSLLMKLQGFMQAVILMIMKALQGIT